MGWHNVNEPANERQTNRTRQRSEHIEASEFAMGEIKRGLPF